MDPAQLSKSFRNKATRKKFPLYMCVFEESYLTPSVSTVYL